MDFKILAVFEQDCHLVVRAEHYQPDGSFWFLEHYTWQGREGLKAKRKTDKRGRLLLSDGKLAPQRGDPPESYLPTGEEWSRHLPPHVDEDSILSTIRGIHKQRLRDGFPGVVDTLSSRPFTRDDASGCQVLTAKFSYLAGRTF